MDQLCRDAAARGAAVSDLFAVPVRVDIGRAKSVPAGEYVEAYAKIERDMEAQIEAIAAKGGQDAMIKEYRTIREVSGPLMIVDQVEGVTYDELGRDPAQRRHGGAAARCWRSTATKLWSSCLSLRPASIWPIPRSAFWAIPCSWVCPAICWAACSTVWASPLTAAPAILAEEFRDINGLAMNPAGRDYPNEFIQTGISTIDGLNTLVRGQKLPIFSGSGLPHAALAAQIARQARVLGDDAGNFAVVFAAIGITLKNPTFLCRNSAAPAPSTVQCSLRIWPTTRRWSALPLRAWPLTAAEYLPLKRICMFWSS